MQNTGITTTSYMKPTGRYQHIQLHRRMLETREGYGIDFTCYQQLVSTLTVKKKIRRKERNSLSQVCLSVDLYMNLSVICTGNAGHGDGVQVERVDFGTPRGADVTAEFVIVSLTQ